MGCDIHCYVEKRIDGAWVNTQPMEPNEEWDEVTKDYVENGEVASKTYISRNYWLFGLLSEGVRTEWPDSFKPKGMPTDLSPEIKYAADTWKDDGHSHSWLTLAELKFKQMALLVSGNAEATQLGGYLRDFCESLFDPTDEPENTRVVFWFDN